MTCIVGLIHDGVTYIGADSLGSNGWSKTVRSDKKVFQLKDINNGIVGFAGSYRMGQLLMYSTGLVDNRDDFQNKIDHEYLVTKFIPNVINLFENGGYSKNKSGEKIGGNFLFGYKDKLYQIESDFQIGESTDGYDAIGSGEMFALGSLYSTKDMDDPIERIKLALDASSYHAVGVQKPYYIHNTKDNKIVEII